MVGTIAYDEWRDFMAAKFIAKSIREEIILNNKNIEAMIETLKCNIQGVTQEIWPSFNEDGFAYAICQAVFIFELHEEAYTQNLKDLRLFDEQIRKEVTILYQEFKAIKALGDDIDSAIREVKKDRDQSRKFVNVYYLEKMADSVNQKVVRLEKVLDTVARPSYSTQSTHFEKL